LILSTIRRKSHIYAMPRNPPPYVGYRVVHKRADEQCSARSHPYEQTSSWLDEHEQSERFGVVRSLVRELSVGEDVYIYAIAIDKPKH